MTAPDLGADELAGIAGKLTAAQRAMVLTDSRRFADQHVGKWSGSSIVQARKLFALGLIEKFHTLAFPTPLGLALRQFLQSKDLPDERD